MPVLWTVPGLVRFTRGIDVVRYGSAIMNRPRRQKTSRWRGCASLLLAVTLVGFLSSCSKPSRDEVIAKDIQTRLALKPELKNTNIVVVVRNGKVTLRGKVPSETAHNVIEKLARQEAGVFAIDDQTSIDVAKREP